MLNRDRLRILIQLRETRNIRRFYVSEFFGVSQTTVSKWELGYNIPSKRFASKFREYLLDVLGLRDNPEEFQDVWKILVDEWGLDPLTEEEYEELKVTFVHDTPLLAPTSLLEDNISDVLQPSISITSSNRVGDKEILLQLQLQAFLCHSSGDKSQVEALSSRLKADGIKPWLDSEQIKGGQDWDLEIRKAIKHSHVCIICLTKSSVAKAGYIQKEMKFALDVAEEQPEGSIFLIPVKLEECELPDQLSRYQWIALYERGGYNKLLDALHERIRVLSFKLVKPQAAFSRSTFLWLGGAILTVLTTLEIIFSLSVNLKTTVENLYAYLNNTSPTPTSISTPTSTSVPTATFTPEQTSTPYPSPTLTVTLASDNVATIEVAFQSTPTEGIITLSTFTPTISITTVIPIVTDELVRSYAYVVKVGDTPLGIARHYGVSVDAMMVSNGLSRSDLTRLRPGQTLVIPVEQAFVATSSITTTDVLVLGYLVQEGDTLVEIANRYSVSLDKLLLTNGFSSGDFTLFRPGRILIIPDEHALIATSSITTTEAEVQNHLLQTPTDTVFRTPTTGPTTAPWTPTPTSNSVDDIKVSLLSPFFGYINQRTLFSWRSNLPLPEGYFFEPAFWQEPGDPLVLGRGWGGSTRELQIALKPEQFLPGSGRYFWGVRILDSTGKPLRLASEINEITVAVPDIPDKPLSPSN